MNANFPTRSFLILALLLIVQMRGQAQWVTQSFDLKAGWNAVYLHVDASHDTLDNLIGPVVTNPIEEIWRWSPSVGDAQFIKDPQTPAQVNSWLNWVRGSPSLATLTRLPGNVACLVRVKSDYIGIYTWNLKGKPVAPHHQWTGSGLNFLGFQTKPGDAAPAFNTFFGTKLNSLNTELFRYVGGPINPVKVDDWTATWVRRGEAFWIKSTNFNRYFGPFDALFSSASGIDFDEVLGQYSFRLRNRTKANLTITLEMIASETSPVEPALVGTPPTPPPLLLRGAINLTNLTYAFSTLALATPRTITLKPESEHGSDVEVVLGLNRSAMNFPAGSLMGGVLRLTALNYMQVDVPVSAKVNSTAGLWVGNAAATKVNQYLTTYHSAETDAEMDALLTSLSLLPAPAGVTYRRDASKRIIKFTSGSGAYLVKNVNTDSTAVARAYPLRLIVHNDPAGTATLLQRAFIGLNTGGDRIVATRESLLDPNKLASARRISASHLPFTAANAGWPFSGPLGLTADITATALVSHDDQASNPFLHTYHPDHDNLDAQFEAPLATGDESYRVSRLFRLVVNPPADDFESLTAAGTQLNGQYTETITLTGRGGFTRNFDVSGGFSLNRITSTPTLTSN